MKSFIRIRATAYTSKSSDGYLNGTVRLEAIAPYLSFQAVQIRSMAILPTPLSHVLSNQANQTSCPRFGFVTLNQTRNAVMLLESDPAISLCPVVGAWVLVDNHLGSTPGDKKRAAQTQDDNLKHYLENPFVWGACLRYRYSDKIKERAFVATETFLLVQFLHYYEFLPLSNNYKPANLIMYTIAVF